MLLYTIKFHKLLDYIWINFTTIFIIAIFVSTITSTITIVTDIINIIIIEDSIGSIIIPFLP